MPKRRNEDAPYWQQLRVAERQIIEYALEHGQTIRKTAEILGISPNYLSERTRELGIVTPEVRPGPKPGTKSTRPMKPNLRVIPGDSPPPPTLPPSTRAVRADEEDDPDVDGDLDEGDLEEDADGDGDGDEANGDEDEDEDEAPGDEDEDDDADDSDDQEEDARESGN